MKKINKAMIVLTASKLRIHHSKTRAGNLYNKMEHTWMTVLMISRTLSHKKWIILKTHILIRITPRLSFLLRK